MPLPRVKTHSIHDVVLSDKIDSATVATTLRFVSPIAGVVERVLACRGGAHSAGEGNLVTIGNNAAKVYSGASGGAALDVDEFEIANPEDAGIEAGGLITIATSGNPAGTTPIGITVVIKRQ